VSEFKAKMHQIRFRLRLRPSGVWGGAAVEIEFGAF